MIRTTVIVFIGLAATPAAADPVAKTPLEACYDAAGTQARTAIGPCLDRLLNDAETAMVTALEARRAEAVELAKVTGRGRTVKSLERSQQRFIAYRKAQCQHETYAVDAGTGAGDVQRDCMVRLTRQRTQTLSGNHWSTGTRCCAKRQTSAR